MKRLQLIVPMLACCLALPCLSFMNVKGSYLALQANATQEYEQYSYVNEKGGTVVLSNRYLLYYTDTVRAIGLVLKPDVGYTTINTRGQELFDVCMVDNGSNYPVSGLFRVLGESGQKMGVTDMEDKVIINPKHDTIFPYRDGLATVVVRNKTVRPTDDPKYEYTVGGKWGFIDKQDNEVIPLRYNSITNYRRFMNGKALILKRGKWIRLPIRQKKG